MRRLLPVVLFVAAACSGSNLAPLDDAANKQTLKDGALTFTASDFTAPGGILWVRPTPVVSKGNIAIQSTRYGSLCQYDVAPHVDVGNGAITMHVSFSQRLTVCTAEIRALRYDAELGVPAGSYALTVIHDEGTARDTVIKQTVAVP